jgi:hypothetical protein
LLRPGLHLARQAIKLPRRAAVCATNSP